MPLIFLSLAPFLFLLISCIQDKNDPRKQTLYDLENPDEIYKLPKQLDEISGIVYIDENRIACVQDEKGIIYLYDLSKNKITEQINFGSDGDYEDIAVKGNEFFILESTGKIFRYIQGRTEVIPTNLRKKENTEGIVYNPQSNSLLIASKKSNKIYHLTLNSKKIDNNLTIDLSAGKISISGIAIHPNTKDLYVLSDNKLLILDSGGNIKETLLLKSSLFPNPEGITFSKEGNLFISNERNGKEARILLFKKNQLD